MLATTTDTSSSKQSSTQQQLLWADTEQICRVYRFCANKKSCHRAKQSPHLPSNHLRKGYGQVIIQMTWYSTVTKGISTIKTQPRKNGSFLALSGRGQEKV